jgi:hypothetical protein
MRYIIGLLAIVSLLASLQSQAQVTQKSWYVNEYAYSSSIERTADGGYVIIGSTGTGGGVVDEDVLLLRLDSKYDTLWSRTFKLQLADRGNAVKELGDGGFIIAGETDSIGSGHEELFLIRTDKNGNELWKKILPGKNAIWCGGITTTADGGYCIATGVQYASSGGVGSILLTRTDDKGTPLWVKPYGRAYINFGYSVRETYDRGFIVCGSSENSSNALEPYLIRTNSNGDTLWTRAFSTPNYFDDVSLMFTKDTGYAIAWGVSGNHYVVHVDDRGNTRRMEEFDSVEVGRGSYTMQSNDGGYIFAGYIPSSNDITAIKVDSNGTRSWIKHITGKGSSDCVAILPTTHGGFLVAGSMQSNDSGHGSAFVLISDCPEFPNASISTLDKLAYCVGDSVAVSLHSAVSFGTNYQWMRDDSIIPSATSTNYRATKAGTYSLIVSDPQGCDNVSNGIRVTVMPYPQKLTIRHYGDTLYCEDIFGSIQWYHEDTLISGATSTHYVATESGKYSVETGGRGICKTMSDPYFVEDAGVKDVAQAQLSITLYPNPFQNTLGVFINNTDDISSARLNIYDVLGHSVCSFHVTDKQSDIDLSSLPNGMYLLGLSTPTGRISKAILKQ